jgi:nucleoside-diphosphate-sugar epimerase
VKILLTGAAGLIGKEVAKGLVSAGFDVLATDLVKDDHSPAQSFVVGDLLSSDFISQLDFSCASGFDSKTRYCL